MTNNIVARTIFRSLAENLRAAVPFRGVRARKMTVAERTVVGQLTEFHKRSLQRQCSREVDKDTEPRFAALATYLPRQEGVVAHSESVIWRLCFL